MLKQNRTTHHVAGGPVVPYRTARLSLSLSSGGGRDETAGEKDAALAGQGAGHGEGATREREGRREIPGDRGRQQRGAVRVTTRCFLFVRGHPAVFTYNCLLSSNSLWSYDMMFILINKY